jgi:TIR domain
MARPRRQKRMVFVSHSARDTWVARQIAREIARCGGRPFLDEAEIEVGQDFEEEILKFLDEADELVVLMTSLGARSPVCVGRTGCRLEPKDPDYHSPSRHDARRVSVETGNSGLCQETQYDGPQRH